MLERGKNPRGELSKVLASLTNLNSHPQCNGLKVVLLQLARPLYEYIKLEKRKGGKNPPRSLTADLGLISGQGVLPSR